jgi:hypothetical protein
MEFGDESQVYLEMNITIVLPMSSKWTVGQRARNAVALTSSHVVQYEIPYCHKIMTLYEMYGPNISNIGRPFNYYCAFV